MNVTGNWNNSRKHSNNSGCPQRDSAEHEEYAGALTGSGITENNITAADRPLRVCSCLNLGGVVYRTVRTLLWEVG